MPSAVNLTPLFEKEIKAVIRAGYYSNKSEVIRDALRTFFKTKSELRIAAAIELYKSKDFTLGKCAEIANLSSLEFKELLIDRGIPIETPTESKENIEDGVKRIKKLRK